MRKLIATTALALIIAGPAVTQTTTGEGSQPATPQQTGQQGGQQAGQQAGQQQQTTTAGQQAGQQQMAGQQQGGQGFYQPQANDLFVSELMDAQVYAPAERGQQQGQMQQGTTQQQTGTATTTQQPGQQQQTGTATTAQQPGQQQAGQTGMQAGQQQAGMQQRGFRERQVTQDDLGGMENIGSVSDVIMDEQGEIQAIVLDVGGFLGMGARQVALSMDQIEFGRDQDDPDSIVVISQVGANELQNAPEFNRDELRQGRQWQQGGQQQTGQQQAGQQQTGQQQTGTTVATTGQPQTAQQPQLQQQQPAGTGQQAAQPGAQQQQWRGDRQTLAAPQMQREGMQQAQPAEITADQLMGANVYDVNDENIGSINDVIMDPQGQAQYAVINVGGFLGLGARSIAIGFDEMQVLHDEGWADLRVYVDATREQLENMPEYQSN